VEKVEATFWDHLYDFRKTLLYCLGIIFASALLCLALHRPLLAILVVKQLDSQPIVLFGPTSGVLLVCKLAFWCGFAFSSPIWLFLLLRFAVPALKKRERRVLVPFFFSSLLFFSLGALFAHRLTIPLANRFLYSFNTRIAENIWDLVTYLDYTFVLLFAHGVAFEGFIVLFFAIHLGLIGKEQLRSARRTAVVGIFIVAALFTPPDVLTQAMLAVPMVLLYECSIVYAALIERRRASRDFHAHLEADANSLPHG